jgi:hypothetical protein
VLPQIYDHSRPGSLEQAHREDALAGIEALKKNG